jgi:hypothetical protein
MITVSIKNEQRKIIFKIDGEESTVKQTENEIREAGDKTRPIFYCFLTLIICVSLLGIILDLASGGEATQSTIGKVFGWLFGVLAIITLSEKSKFKEELSIEIDLNEDCYPRLSKIKRGFDLIKDSFDNEIDFSCNNISDDFQIKNGIAFHSSNDINVVFIGEDLVFNLNSKTFQNIDFIGTVTPSIKRYSSQFRIDLTGNYFTKPKLCYKHLRDDGKPDNRFRNDYEYASQRFIISVVLCGSISFVMKSVSIFCIDRNAVNNLFTRDNSKVSNVNIFTKKKISELDNLDAFEDYPDIEIIDSEERSWLSKQQKRNNRLLEEKEAIYDELYDYSSKTKAILQVIDNKHEIPLSKLEFIVGGEKEIEHYMSFLKENNIEIVNDVFEPEENQYNNNEKSKINLELTSGEKSKILKAGESGYGIIAKSKILSIISSDYKYNKAIQFAMNKGFFLNNDLEKNKDNIKLNVKEPVTQFITKDQESLISPQCNDKFEAIKVNYGTISLIERAKLLSIFKQEAIESTEDNINEFLKIFSLKYLTNNLYISNDCFSIEQVIIKHQVINGIFKYDSSISDSTYESSVNYLVTSNILYQINDLEYLAFVNGGLHNASMLKNIFDWLNQKIGLDGFLTYKIMSDENTSINLLIQKYGLFYFDKFLKYDYYLVKSETMFKEPIFLDARNKLKRDSIIEKMFINEEKNHLNVYDFIDIVKKKYQLSIESDKLKRDILKTGLYMNGDYIYINKQTFLEELHHEI